jgi:hypothetical protein
MKNGNASREAGDEITLRQSQKTTWLIGTYAEYEEETGAKAVEAIVEGDGVLLRKNTGRPDPSRDDGNRTGQ